MKAIGILLGFLSISLTSSAQLPNGSTAPDFNLVDIDGNSHRLYDYLAEGKVVFLEIFACHCPSCWAYHNTGTLESLYQTYGPTGTDQIMVIMIEHDINNTLNEFGGGGNTQGDWLTNSTIPKINAEGDDRSVFGDYNLTYYPVVYKICTDKTTELMSTSFSTTELFQKADACPGALSIGETSESFDFRIDNINKQLILNNYNGIKTINIINLMGQSVERIERINKNTFGLSQLTNGIYFLQIEYNKEAIIKKVYLEF